MTVAVAVLYWALVTSQALKMFGVSVLIMGMGVAGIGMIDASRGQGDWLATVKVGWLCFAVGVAALVVGA